MKRWMPALILSVLIPSGALAFDLSPYEVPGSGLNYGSQVTPITSGSALVDTSSMHVRQPDIAALIKDGRTVEEISFPYDPSRLIEYAPYLKKDHTLGAVRHINTLEGTFDPSGFALYDVQNGQLMNERLIEGTPTSFSVHKGAFVGLCESDGQNAVLMIYDQDGRVRYTYQLPSQHAWLQDICPDGEELILMLELWEGLPERQMLTMRIAPDGHILWQLWHRYTVPGVYNRVLKSVNGGALLIASAEEDYKIKQIACVSADGQILWEKKFSAPKAVFGVNASIPHPETTSVTLVGTVIANSRGLFNAFTMELNLDGNLLALDVRDFSARADYNFSCKLDQNDVPYAVSDSLIFPNREDGTKSIAVPFDHLPKAKDPGILIR